MKIYLGPFTDRDIRLRELPAHYIPVFSRVPEPKSVSRFDTICLPRGAAHNGPSRVERYLTTKNSWVPQESFADIRFEQLRSSDIITGPFIDYDTAYHLDDFQEKLIVQNATASQLHLTIGYESSVTWPLLCEDTLALDRLLRLSTHVSLIVSLFGDLGTWKSVRSTIPELAGIYFPIVAGSRCEQFFSYRVADALQIAAELQRT